MLRASLLLLVLACAFVGLVHSQPQNFYNNQPYYGAAQPYYGAAQPYYGAAQPYYGAAQPYYGGAQPFYASPYVSTPNAILGEISQLIPDVNVNVAPGGLAGPHPVRAGIPIVGGPIGGGPIGGGPIATPIVTRPIVVGAPGFGPAPGPVGFGPGPF